jgi:hypothetical protein
MGRFRLVPLAVLCLFVVAHARPLYGQETDADRQELIERLQLLETEVEQMRQELSHLRAALGPTPVVEEKSAAGERRTMVTVNERPSAPSEEKRPGFGVGPWRAIPYGTIYFNVFSNSSGTNNADVPLFAAAGAGNISATARQTRLGLRLDGPILAGAKLTALVESDFFGGFPSIGVGETFGVVRLRLAYARLQWQHTGLEVGQDWTIFAPNNPVSIASAAIPQLVSAGNLWMRLPQVRIEHRGGRDVKWLAQAAVLMPGTGDFPTGTASPFLLQPGAGARARLPYFQGRVSLSQENWLGLKTAATLGVSANYGRARITTPAGDHESDSVGAALDWNLPLAPRLSLLGEAFFGRNLAGFQGGIFQGINSDFAYRSGGVLVPGGPRAIGSRGGWAQLGFTPPGADRLTFYAGYGLDDPRDEDLVSVPARDWRARNQVFTASFLYKFSPQFSVGMEFRRFETLYTQSGRRLNNHINLGVATSF